MTEFLQAVSPYYDEQFLSNSEPSTAYQTPNDGSLNSGKNKRSTNGFSKLGSLLVQAAPPTDEFQSPDLLPGTPDVSCNASTALYTAFQMEPGQQEMASGQKQETSKPQIGIKEDANPFLVCNKHILGGYRIGYDSWGATVCSLFQFHNETVNIWTHFLGFIVCFIAMMIMSFGQTGDEQTSITEQASRLLYMFQSDGNVEEGAGDYFDTGFIESQKAEFNVFMATLEQLMRADQIESGEAKRTWFLDYKAAEKVNTWPLIAYLLTAMFCLGFSTICHLCFVKSPRISRIVSSLDYWGIAVLFLGSSYPFISYKYACGVYIFWRYIFMACITILTLACMYITLKSSFDSPNKRALLFTAFGASVLVPKVGLEFWKDEQYTLEPNLAPFGLAILAYVIGLFFYVSKVPERFSKTGRFDYIGSSHQIFHCFVLLGVAITFYDSYQVYLERLDFVCPEQKQH